MAMLAGCSAATAKRDQAAFARTYHKDATAVDRTLRTQISAIECPFQFMLLPVVGFTITPRIVFRQPAPTPGPATVQIKKGVTI